MEGKKVLWVLFSVTLVLVVVLAAGLFLLRPKAPKPAEAGVQAPPSVQGYDAYEYVRGTSGTPGLAPPPAKPPEQVTIVVGEQPGQPAPAPATEPLPAPPTAPAPAPSVVAPPVQAAPAPAPKAEAAPAARPAGGVAAKPAAVPAAKPAAAPAAKPAAVPVAKPAAKPAPRQVRVKEYWIQTGSYSSASRAEEVVQVLADKGLAAKTSTLQLDGQTHFRVRIGPYANKAEANKFLTWLQAIKGFEASYISQVRARRTDP